MGKKKEELYQADLDLCNDVGPCFRFEQNKPGSQGRKDARLLVAKAHEKHDRGGIAD